MIRQVGPGEILKPLAFAALVGLLIVHWLSATTAAAIAVAALWIIWMGVL